MNMLYGAPMLIKTTRPKPMSKARAVIAAAQTMRAGGTLGGLPATGVATLAMVGKAR